MLKKAFAVILAVGLIAAMTTVVSARSEAGVSVRPDGSFCGAIFDTVEAGFEVGKSYTLFVKLESYGTAGFRFRWSSGDGGESGGFVHNDTNNDAHSSAGARAAGHHATQVPALFHPDDAGIGFGDVVTLSITFTFGADIPDLDPKTERFIGIFGMWGGDDYEVLDAWWEAADAPAAEAPAAEAPAAEAPVQESAPAGAKDPGSPVTGSTGVLALAGIAALASAVGLFALKRRVK